MFRLSRLLLARHGHTFSMVLFVFLRCSLRLVKLVTLVELSKGFCFIGLSCQSDNIIVCGKTGDTGQAAQGLLPIGFHYICCILGSGTSLMRSGIRA